ncbi:MAG TPA: M48 family metalloprotease [bacterium]
MRLTPPDFYTVQKNEKAKSVLLLMPLLALYLILIFLLYLPFKLFYVYADMIPQVEDIVNEKVPTFADYVSATFHLSAVECGIIGFSAVCIALVNWFNARAMPADKVLKAFSARPPNPSDLKEKTYQHAVEEMRISAGLPVIDTYVLPTAAYNAFALTDMQGRTFIAVTQGIISDFERSELQSVVAHELAHVIRGDSFYIAFISFLIQSFLGKKIDNAILHFNAKIVAFPRGNEKRDESIVNEYLVLIRPVVWAMRFFGCFISRRRELLADATGVGLTRNPFALAKAINRADKGNSDLGIRADAFNHLFIVAPRNRGIDVREGFLANLFSSHPPVIRRLWVLLIMARKSFADLYGENKKGVARV